MAFTEMNNLKNQTFILRQGNMTDQEFIRFSDNIVNKFRNEHKVRFYSQESHRTPEGKYDIIGIAQYE